MLALLLALLAGTPTSYDEYWAARAEALKGTPAAAQAEKCRTARDAACVARYQRWAADVLGFSELPPDLTPDKLEVALLRKALSAAVQPGSGNPATPKDAPTFETCLRACGGDGRLLQFVQKGDFVQCLCRG